MADCCPHCESIRIVAKRGGMSASRRHPEDHYCESCSMHFDDPDQTDDASYPNNHGGSDTAQALLDADGEIRGGA